MRSPCCNASVSVRTSRYEDRPSHWYACDKCGKACDPVEGEPVEPQGFGPYGEE